VQGTGLPESVHLSDWPSVNKPDDTSRKLLEEMRVARLVVQNGLASRANLGIKVRQPLASLTYSCILKLRPEIESIVADETNVKEVKYDPDYTTFEISIGEQTVETTGIRAGVDKEITSELKAEGIARDLIRFVQNARKNAGFNVEDRIKLKITSENSEITEAAASHKDTIFGETLATGELDGAGDHSETVKLDGAEIEISVSKTDTN